LAIGVGPEHTNRKINCQPFVFAAIGINAVVSHTLLQKVEAVATELTTERINIKQTHQSLFPSLPANPPDELSIAFGTNY
jgi:hypothetical protein